MPPLKVVWIRPWVDNDRCVIEIIYRASRGAALFDFERADSLQNEQASSLSACNQSLFPPDAILRLFRAHVLTEYAGISSYYWSMSGSDSNRGTCRNIILRVSG